LPYKYNRFQSLKVLSHIDKIRDIKKGVIPAPVEWIIYPSNGCPYDCSHCIMKEERESKECLSPDVMAKIPEDVVEHGIKTVIFSGGGEPLSNKATTTTARVLKDLGIHTGINTNGLLLDTIKPFNFVRVSVDAATRETYKGVKGYDGWDTVNANLDKCFHEKTGEKIGLAFLITPDNYHEVYQFCEWASQYDYGFLHIRPAFYSDDRDKKMREITSYLMTVKEAVEKDFRDVFFKIDKFEGYWTPKLFDKCRATPLMAVLAADGKFVVCQDVFIRFGDYRKHSFEEAWWGMEHKKALSKIDITKCPRCVENTYNEVIEHIDKIEVNLL